MGNSYLRRISYKDYSVYSQGPICSPDEELYMRIAKSLAKLLGEYIARLTAADALATMEVRVGK